MENWTVYLYHNCFGSATYGVDSFSVLEICFKEDFDEPRTKMTDQSSVNEKTSRHDVVPPQH